MYKYLYLSNCTSVMLVSEEEVVRKFKVVLHYHIICVFGIVGMMYLKAIFACITVFVGCSLNIISLEYIIRLNPDAGPFLTFLQFLFITAHGFIFTSKFGTVQPKISRRCYAVLVIMFFSSSVLSNWAFAFNIPVPLIMVFKSASLIANLFMGMIVLKKKYTTDKYFSVILITLGISVCSVAYSGSRMKECCTCDSINPIDGIAHKDADHVFWWIIGIVLLSAATLLSARMGIYQETLYKTQGKYPNEALYYTHLYSLPGFILYGRSIWHHVRVANGTELYRVPLLNFFIPLFWVFVIINVTTQYICIKSVHVLTSECTSLTVTFVLTLRKMVSLIISVVYFQNHFSETQWFGAFLVFCGSLIFTEIISIEHLRCLIKRMKSLKGR